MTGKVYNKKLMMFWCPAFPLFEKTMMRKSKWVTFGRPQLSPPPAAPPTSEKVNESESKIPTSGGTWWVPLSHHHLPTNCCCFKKKLQLRTFYEWTREQDLPIQVEMCKFYTVKVEKNFTIPLHIWCKYYPYLCTVSNSVNDISIIAITMLV